MLDLFYIMFALTIIMVSITFLEGFFLKRKNYMPVCSFIVPCYNCEESIEDCINSIYSSYPLNKINLIAINDCSNDNTLNILNNLRKKYKFKIINNHRNLGKVESVNTASLISNGEILIFIDSDTVINQTSLLNVLSRFKNNVGGVSSRLIIKSNNILDRLVSMQYNMLSLSVSSYNLWSGISLWGGFMAVRRDAFFQCGCFSYNSIGEDMDMALKLNEAGWKIENDFSCSETYPPKNLKDWYKQTFRWGSSFSQNAIKHYKVMIKNPLVFIFFILYTSITIYSLFFYKNNLNWFTNVFLYSLLSIPYITFDIKRLKDIKFIPLIFVFSVVYYPIYSIIASIGMINGIVRYKKLKEGVRAW